MACCESCKEDKVDHRIVGWLVAMIRGGKLVILLARNGSCGAFCV